MTAADRARGLLELTRPANAVAAGLLTVVGAFVALGSWSETAAIRVAAASATTVFATGAGMAINDYFDREIDRINDPHRPIPRGAVQPRLALAFSGALFAVALALTVTLPAVAIAIAAVNLLALVTYTNLFKGTPGLGNALVSYLVGSAFVFGGAAVGDPGASVVLAVLAGLSTFAREVIKDVEDVAGDRQEGLETLPIVVGERRALHLASASLGVAVLASPVPYFLDMLGLAYLVVVSPAVAVMVYAAVEGYRDAAAAQSTLKYGMFLATAAFVVGRATLVL